jgi:predicted esterase
MGIAAVGGFCFEQVNSVSRQTPPLLMLHGSGGSALSLMGLSTASRPTVPLSTCAAAYLGKAGALSSDETRIGFLITTISIGGRRSFAASSLNSTPKAMANRG